MRRLQKIFIVTTAVVVTCVVVLGIAAFLFLEFGLPKAPEKVVGAPAVPDLSDISRAEWEAGRDALLNRFELEIYGEFPDSEPVTLLARREVVSPYQIPTTVESLTLQMGARTLEVALIIPAGDEPAPVIVFSNECGNAPFLDNAELPQPTAWAWPGFCTEQTFFRTFARYIFGAHIFGPPIEEILARGFAVAAFHESEIVPDEPVLAEPILNSFVSDKHNRPGAIALWAWGLAQTASYLDTDERIDPARTIVFGHSRRGKAVLVAAAFSPHIDAVIAHQSGTGGASLNYEKRGEGIASITEQYPHWFGPGYASLASSTHPELDQHQLLALIAPRPVFLGNGVYDGWSDPEGAFRAATGADVVYELYGSPGLEQDYGTVPKGPLAFSLRPGRHGITKGDWDNFFTFIDTWVR